MMGNWLDFQRSTGVNLYGKTESTIILEGE